MIHEARLRLSRRDTNELDSLPAWLTRVVLADQVGGTMHMVMDSLAPAERVAFVLHDVFGYPFDDISALLGRSGMATRKLAIRARYKLQDAPETNEEKTARDEHEQVVGAFLAAPRGGEMTEMLALLAPDAVMRAEAIGIQMGTDPVYDAPGAVAERFATSLRCASLAVWRSRS